MKKVLQVKRLNELLNRYYKLTNSLGILKEVRPIEMTVVLNELMPVLERREKKNPRELGEVWLAARQSVLGSDPIDRYIDRLKVLIQSSRVTVISVDVALAILYCAAAEIICQRTLEGRGDFANLYLLLKYVPKIDGDEFEADLCPFEHVLNADPAMVYPRMSMEAKRSYRRQIYALAGRRVDDQISLALEKLSAAQAALPGSFGRHIGEHLWDSRGSSLNILSFAKYGLISLAAGILYASLLILVAPFNWVGPALWAILAVILYQALNPTSEFLCGMTLSERPLHSMDFRLGLPEDLRVAIAIPILLRDKAHLEEIFAFAERNYLVANDSQVTVVLLTDYQDSEVELPTASEVELLETYKRRIGQLNKKYGTSELAPFALFHRNRSYCASERRWMGWERKRGKIEDFNAFLLGKSNQFAVQLAADRLPGCKYVLVLDEDCLLGRDALQAMVGTLEHPLSQPRLDENYIVRRGHALVVPNTSTLTSSLARWRFSFLVAGPQSSANSRPPPTRNFLFDISGRCHFPGKGLLHVEAFYKACAGRIPPSTVLSHDTIEAAWTRPAYLGYACIKEGFPRCVDGLISRNHRWMRGNIQNLWYSIISPEKFPFEFWYVLAHQILTDLTPALLFFVSLAVALGLAFPQTISLAVAFTIASPCIRALGAAGSYLKQLNFLSFIIALPGIVGRLAAIAAFRVSSCGTFGLIFLDAAFRSSMRFLTKRMLLEWVPTAQIARTMRGAPYCYDIVVALFAIILLTSRLAQTRTPIVEVVLTSWICFPVLARYMDSRI